MRNSQQLQGVYEDQSKWRWNTAEINEMMSWKLKYYSRTSFFLLCKKVIFNKACQSIYFKYHCFGFVLSAECSHISTDLDDWHENFTANRMHVTSGIIQSECRKVHEWRSDWCTKATQQKRRLKSKLHFCCYLLAECTFPIWSFSLKPVAG